MAEQLDQIFVTLQHWLVGLAPEVLQPLVAAVLPVAGIVGIFAGLFAVTTIVERKGLGRFQNRYGPNRVGPFGLLQPMAEIVKFARKEPFRTITSVDYLYRI